MISISRSKTASSGSSYFEKDSYYATSEKTSQWYGRGAQELGLSGVVNHNDFDIVINGFDLDKKPLVENSGAKDRKDKEGEVINGRAAYIDLTFSAPKSVSLMSYVDPRIEEAHNKAVERAITKIENEYTFTRKTIAGERIEVRENSALIARINHYESREVEPQLHSHLVLMNLIKGDDGKWWSRQNKAIYDNQMHLGQLYRNELSNELRKIGYQVEVTDRTKGLYEIQGISRNIIEDFSTRRKQVKEAEADYKDYECSDARKRELACLSSRKEKRDNDVDAIRATTNNKLTVKYGTTLEEIKEKALKIEQVQRPEIPAEKAIEMALEEVTDKQAGFRREDVLNHAMKACLGQHTEAQLSNAFDQNQSIEILGDKNKYSLHAKSTITIYSTSDMIKTESNIMNWARDWKKASSLCIKPDKLKVHLDSLAAQGISLEKGQREAIEMICTTKDRLSLVQGDAGAGKSFAMGHIKSIMEAEGITVRGYSPTGKATQSMKEAGLLESVTIDKILVSQNHQAQLREGEIWLIDEAGMLGSRKMERFLKLAEEKKAKVVLIGDTKQFKSVEQGKLFSDLQKHSGVAYAEILEVKRQKNETAKAIVTAIKDHEFDRAFRTLEQSDSLHEIKSEADRHQAIAEKYLGDIKSNCVILAQTNSTKNAINRLVRDRLVDRGEVERGSTFKMYQKAPTDKVTCHFVESYRPGQRIIFTKDCEQVKLQPNEKGAKAQCVGVEGEVLHVSKERNSVSIQYWDKNAKQYAWAEVDLLRHGKKFQTYDIVEKKFGIGDKVMFCKNDSRVDVSNGEAGTIKEIDDKGNARIEIKEKDSVKSISCNLNNKGDKGYTYLDNAYCITDHKSQGSTYDSVIVANDVSTKSNFNAFYVEATRMRHQVTIFTNDKAALKEQVEIEQDKPSTFDDYDYSKYRKQEQQNFVEIRQERKQLEAYLAAINQSKDKAEIKGTDAGIAKKADDLLKQAETLVQEKREASKKQSLAATRSIDRVALSPNQLIDNKAPSLKTSKEINEKNLGLDL